MDEFTLVVPETDPEVVCVGGRCGSASTTQDDKTAPRLLTHQTRKSEHHPQCSYRSTEFPAEGLLGGLLLRFFRCDWVCEEEERGEDEKRREQRREDERRE